MIILHFRGFVKGFGEICGESEGDFFGGGGVSGSSPMRRGAEEENRPHREAGRRIDKGRKRWYNRGDSARIRGKIEKKPRNRETNFPFPPSE